MRHVWLLLYRGLRFAMRQLARAHFPCDDSTFRLFPVRGMEELFTAIGRHSRPVLVIWGEHDKICPYRKSIEVLEAAFPKGYIVDIRECGHNPIVEKFDETMTEVLAFHKQTYDTVSVLSVAHVFTFFSFLYFLFSYFPCF